ncbi:transposase [Apiospora hydei]|uniref:Transposase n=1 Tax=Apiospora hydei TaxID=1337664 RepID=A0ABR1X9Y8_9PEZI
MAKPLLSPHLLENTGYTTADPAKTGPNGSNKALYTPRNTAREFKEQVRLVNLLKEYTTTQRQLFRKVRKAFDEKERQVEALQAQLEAVRPRKRKKVNLSPNSKFATIEDIQRTQLAVGEAENSLNEESDSDNSKAGSCIVVTVRTS